MPAGSIICGDCGGEVIVIGGDLYRCLGCGREIDMAEDQDEDELD